jgi:hypothetical protein
MAPMPKIDMAIPLSWMGNVSIMIAWLMGTSAPPAAPCRILKKMSVPRLGAAPQRKDEKVKRTMQVMRNRFLPKTRASHPVIGMITALLIR